MNLEIALSYNFTLEYFFPVIRDSNPQQQEMVCGGRRKLSEVFTKLSNQRETFFFPLPFLCDLMKPRAGLFLWIFGKLILRISCEIKLCQEGGN